MRFVTFSEAAARFAGKRVAVVGSAPCALENEIGFVDSHDVVVRVNNYKLGPGQGTKIDVHHSFYGNSIRKDRDVVRLDGVTLCMCKCPNSKPLSSSWHEIHRKPEGVDYRWIYKLRAGWWFCDTYVPTDDRFLAQFNLLGGHVPTTGFSAILDVLDARPAKIYVTGFDFFTSKRHNVDEAWREGDPTDPIGHRPELELAWLSENAHRYPLEGDGKLRALVKAHREALEAS